MTSDQKLSIVIPAKNEAAFLPRLLNSLVSQTGLNTSHLKVFVADANSTDETRTIALSFRDRLDVQVIPGGLPSVGRNAGARLAVSQYILFIDADVELRDRTLLMRALGVMKRRKLECVTTSVACLDGTLPDHMLYAISNLVQRVASFFQPFGTGMFLLFDRKAFERLGGFNERALFAEDYLLSKQVPVWRFGIVRGHVMTSARRFRKVGRGRMIQLFIRTMLNTYNPSYFLEDQDYWTTEETREEKSSETVT
jgi:glycosyltransferase involved in cell wall biosynthesis